MKSKPKIVKPPAMRVRVRFTGAAVVKTATAAKITYKVGG
jgi:hypothetical protein